MHQAILRATQAAMILGLVFSSCLCGQDFGDSAVRPTVPFQLLSDFLVVVNGRIGELDGLKFILDTGASYTLIDQKVADRLKLHRGPGKVTNFGHEVPVDWAEIPDLQVGPLRTGAFRVMIAKLGKYSSFAEHVDGIIGLDLLSRSKKLFIDYEKQTVSWELVGDAAGQQPAPGYFTVPIVVQGVPMHLVIDTGFQVILLYKDRLHRELPGLRTEGELVEGGVGRLQTTRVKLPGVRLFGRETAATVYLADGPDAGKLPGIDGFLGVASLQAKWVEFDFAARVLRWQ